MSSPLESFFVVRPQDLNHAGTAFGGTMMARADELAYIAAALEYPGCTFVTKVFREFNFVHGAVEGDIVRIEAQVLGRGKSSVRVSVVASHAVGGQEFFRTEAVLVNAKDGKSMPIGGEGSGRE